MDLAFKQMQIFLWTQKGISEAFAHLCYRLREKKRAYIGYSKAKYTLFVSWNGIGVHSTLLNGQVMSVLICMRYLYKSVLSNDSLKLIINCNTVDKRGGVYINLQLAAHSVLLPRVGVWLYYCCLRSNCPRAVLVLA